MADTVAFSLRFGKNGGPPRRFELSRGDGRAVKIGRFAKNDVVVDLPGISLHHCELMLLVPGPRDVGGPRLGIVDLSSNCTGLKVPGGSVMRLPKRVETVLPHGSLVVLPMKVKPSEQAKAEALRMCFVVELERPGVPHAADPAEGLPLEQDAIAAAAATSALAALEAMNIRSAGGAAPAPAAAFMPATPALPQPPAAPAPPLPAPAFLPPPSQAPAQPSAAPAAPAPAPTRPSAALAAQPPPPAGAPAMPPPPPGLAAAAPAELRRPDRPRRDRSEERGGRTNDRGRQERGDRRSRSRRRSPHDRGRDRRDKRSRSRRRDDRGERDQERRDRGDELDRWGSRPADSNRIPVGVRAGAAPANGGRGHALIVGAEVEVRYRGKWWDGKVVAPPCFGKVRCDVDGREYDMEEADVRPRVHADEPPSAAERRFADGGGAESRRRGGWGDEAPPARQVPSKWPAEEKFPAAPEVLEPGAPRAPSGVMTTGQVRAMMDAKAAFPAQPPPAGGCWADSMAMGVATSKASPPSFSPPPGRPPPMPTPPPRPSSAIGAPAIGARAGAAPGLVAPLQYEASVVSKSRGPPPAAPPAEAEWLAALSAKAAGGPPPPTVGSAGGAAASTRPLAAQRVAVMEPPSPESPN